MSIRDAIKELRGAAKRLDAATFNPNMNALAEFVDGLDSNGITAARRSATGFGKISARR